MSRLFCYDLCTVWTPYMDSDVRVGEILTLLCKRSKAVWDKD